MSKLNIINMLNWLKQADKVKYFKAGILLGFFTTFIGAIVGGLYKESKDKKNGGTFNWYDFLATLIGGVIGSLWFIVGLFVGMGYGVVIFLLSYFIFTIIFYNKQLVKDVKTVLGL